MVDWWMVDWWMVDGGWWCDWWIGGWWCGGVIGGVIEQPNRHNTHTHTPTHLHTYTPTHLHTFQKPKQNQLGVVGHEQHLDGAASLNLAELCEACLVVAAQSAAATMDAKVVAAKSSDQARGRREVCLWRLRVGFDTALHPAPHELHHVGDRRAGCTDWDTNACHWASHSAADPDPHRWSRTWSTLSTWSTWRQQQRCNSPPHMCQAWKAKLVRLVEEHHAHVA